MNEEQGDYFSNHARVRRFPWTLYHRPIEADLGRFLGQVAAEHPGPEAGPLGSMTRGHPAGELLVVGCGLLHELDAAPSGLRFHVADIDPRAIDAVLARRDPRILGGTVVAPERPIALAELGREGRGFAGIYAKEVIEHVLSWPAWLTGLRRALVPGGRLWLSTPNYGEPWLPALESTVLELIARRSGFTRRHLHPARFSARSLARGLRAAGFESVLPKIMPTRLAITAWAQAPR